MVRTIFAMFASVISIYAILCVVRIVLTWVPQATFHPVTKFLASVCDPFLDLFHGIRWMRIGGLDFSPAIALCTLGAVSTILSHLANSSSLRLGFILGLLVQTIWSIASSVISFLIIVLIIRLIVMLVSGSSFSNNPLLYQLDQTLGGIVRAISRTFAGNRQISYKTGLIIAIVALIVLNFIGNLVIARLAILLSGLPL
ncbi:MAG: YggT family protein [Treponema sp.]|nr:YggT family protein [Treponema sp.]